MDLDAERDLLFRALSVGVLVSEDVLERGWPSESVLDGLVSEGVFPAKAKAALSRLCALRPVVAPRTFDVERPLGRPSGDRRSFGTRKAARPATVVSATLARAPSRVGMVGTVDTERDELSPARLHMGGVASGTLAGEVEVAETSEDGSGVTGGLRGLIDLTVLEPEEQRAIAEASFCRTAVRLEFITFQQARAAIESERPGEDLLGLSPPEQLQVLQERDRLKHICSTCLAEQEDSAQRCGHCGATQDTRSGMRGTGTLACDEGAFGVEGFPGSAEEFAGHIILERIAEGGMGVVFRARQVELNRVVALKVMRGGALASKKRRRRFLQEAEAAAGLQHPNIVAVHQIDEVAGYPFFTMDYVKGGVAIDEYVRSHDSTSEEIAVLVRKMAEAVQHFHQNGIIHRDLKPGNVLVDEAGDPKIIDFGIAKRVDASPHESLTVEGNLVGTPEYMAPEQAGGRIREVDTRTDVYALGTILYALLTGAPPFAGMPQANLVVAIQDEDPPPVRQRNRDVEADLAAIVGMAMAKERERRYQSAHELVLDLERFERCLPVVAKPATLLYRLRKVVRRRLPAVVAVGVCLLAIGGALGSVAWNRHERAQSIETLLRSARGPDLSVEEREDLLSRVLALDSQNLTAQSERRVLVERRQTEKRLRAERAKQELARANAELRRERAEREARELRARQQARKDAETKARERAHERASALLARSQRNPSALAAVADVTDGLALLPGKSPLRTKLMARQVDLALQLARKALIDNEPAMARFWMRRLDGADTGAHARQVAAVRRGIHQLQSGSQLVEEAKALVKAGGWLAARDKLEQAKDGGLETKDLQQQRALINNHCVAEARKLAQRGRALLMRGEALKALTAARQARRFSDTRETRRLVDDAGARVSAQAERKALLLSLEPNGVPSAVSVLERAREVLETGALRASLASEAQHYRALVDDKDLRGTVYVPRSLPGVERSFFVARLEVTNAEFAEFITAGGYRDGRWWDAAGGALRATFRDACATCKHQAPRGWVDGGYGGRANARRPVRGVTIHEARAFARWKSHRAGARWRLPTEAEWEIAAGWNPVSGRGNTYPWGAEFQTTFAIETELPHPVGAAKGDRSPLGLWDVGGNVLEWTEGRRRPATKGAGFGMSMAVCRHFAQVKVSGYPGAAPSRTLLRLIGFRLVRETGRRK